MQMENLARSNHEDQGWTLCPQGGEYSERWHLGDPEAEAWEEGIKQGKGHQEN